ncbi:MAG: GNAT family N-acetyltransferase [Myxococcales bacterium]|nr:GNAT family N-acetyltransferase [Myxococcota bacterium]MDW8280808.1 GNAT family N-acetyltransferase [Myxococcales bacterium]
MRIEVVSDLRQVDPAAWDALLAPGDAPLLSWAYLQALEEAGCVGPGTSWRPAHLCARSIDGTLLAAAPAYIKLDSDGEWVHDFDWPVLAARLGLAYYPKLVLAVPFNPVTGRRLLVPAGLSPGEVRERRQALLAGAQALCHQAGLSSVHVLFHDEHEQQDLVEAGFCLRSQEQYHFLNEGYRSFDDFVARLRHGRRKSVRRERRVLAEAGIVVRTLRGLGGEQGFTMAELDAMFDLYRGTSERYTGGAPYLNRRFFHLCGERLGDRLELVLARGPDGRLLGGAFDLRGDRRLYGRYWGEAEHVPFLHFEVCFYHAIERCIAEGLEAFEPGHGGDQKLLRGFWPVRTYSAHRMRDARLDRTIRQYVALEAPYVTAQLAASRRRCPLRRPGEEPKGATPPAEKAPPEDV